MSNVYKLSNATFDNLTRILQCPANRPTVTVDDLLEVGSSSEESCGVIMDA